jgi:hypothetical protein
MITTDSSQFVFILATSLTMLGVVSIGAGIILLLTRASGSAIKSITTQTTRLAQKGLAEEIVGLVGNASALMDTINQMVKTTAGIGIFLILFGFVMLVSAFLMLKFF